MEKTLNKKGYFALRAGRAILARILVTVEGLFAHFPSETRVLIIQFGKLLVIFPLIGIAGVKVFKKGISNFSG